MGAVGPGAREQEEQVGRTFLFSDIEGSTRRWQAQPDQMREMLVAHDDTLRRAVEAHGGSVFKHTGDGMCAAFASAGDAVAAAVEAQRQLELPVRMAVHTGEAFERGGDFFGVSLSRCARLMDAAHGGQVLVSAASAELAPSGLELLDLGEHRLRDLREPERIFQVVAADLSQEFPPLRTLDAVRHNLPVLRSTFIGRESELVDVCERLGSGQLVTLTGIGGCGKTRLALEAATRLIDRFPQGVFFVNLAILADPDLVNQTVANAIGVQLVQPTVTSLGEYLTGRRALLVLDNCEHVVDVCADLADGLLSRCPGLHILATSREPLGVDGEQVFRVPSLDLSTDAIGLFVDRARAAGGAAHVSEDATVAEICRRLDGIPLAIELAAARTTHLAPAQILERLADRFRLLTGGRRRVHRQQTLSAAIDWSHDLLTEDEQLLFRRLAVFRGSFPLEAAEQVCHPDAVDLLRSLVDKSLVNLQFDTEAPRYRLLETVRVYAEERLIASGEASSVRSAHRDWFLRWIESLPVDHLVALSSGAQLEADADNLAAALDWSLEEKRFDLIARIAGRMIGYWWSYVRVTELTGWWGVLEPQIARLPVDLRANALVVGVQRAMAIADFEQMQQLSARAVEEAAPDSWVAAFAWSLQALYWTYVDPNRAKHCIEQGRRAATAAHAPLLDTMTAMWSANLLTGDPARDQQIGGREILDSVLAGADEGSLGGAYLFLAIIAAMGDPETASRLMNPRGDTTPSQQFGLQFATAVIAIRQGRPDAARRSLCALAAVVREHGLPLGEAACLTGFAALAAETGDYERASRCLASVRTAAPWPFRTPVDGLLYKQATRLVRDALDAETASRCRAEGSRMSVSDALNDELAHHASLAATAPEPTHTQVRVPAR